MMAFSGVEEVDSLEDYHEVDKILRNKVSYPVFSETVNRDLSKCDGDDDSSIAMVARIDK